MILAATMPANAFVKEHVLSGQSTVCTAPEYAALKAEIAEKLTITPDSLRLIGSAKLGFSLNADHLLKLFGSHSDLDFVVVNSNLFDAASLEMVERSEEISLEGEDQRKRMKRTKENIFQGFFRADQLPLSASLSKDWFPRLAGPFEHELARRHTVKAWLFKSAEHAQILYANHHAKQQPGVIQLLKSRGDL